MTSAQDLHIKADRDSVCAVTIASRTTASLLSNQALVIAIQAIDREIRRMRPWVESDESAPENAMLLEDWERAAEELEQIYDAAAQVALNLPPYEALVKR